MLKNDIITSDSKYIKPFKIIFWMISNLGLIPLIFVLYLLKPLFRIQFLKIRDERIGHLAANTDLFLRRLKLGIIRKKRTLFVGIASTKPSNKQLFKMFKREMTIIQIPKLLNDVLFSEKSLLVKSGFGMHLPLKSNQFYEFTYGKPNIHFTSQEEKKGKKLLKDMNISAKDWFICFHARDKKYLEKSLSSMDTSCHNFRDWDINSALKAVEYIASKRGFALRMGAIVEKKLPKLKSPRIIDYAANYRTEFGDIYLPSKCKFLLGCSSGIGMVTQAFNVPAIFSNLIPLDFPPYSKRDLFIPKKIWSKKKKRFLTFKEIINSKVNEYSHQELYVKEGLVPVENTPKEILDLAIEMNERLDGTWKTTKKDEELQKRFKSLFKKGSHCYGFPSRIGTKFLRQNKDLLK
jgi:putative glycosyltransferase (TIGR04372 family)